MTLATAPTVRPPIGMRDGHRGEFLTGVLGAWAGRHASPGVARKHRRLQTKLLPLVLVRHRVEFFDAFVRCEAPCPM